MAAATSAELVLDCGPLGMVPCLGWDAHNKPRVGLEPGTFHDRFPHKEPVAFFDRNCIANPCDRKVLLVRGEHEMYVFSEHGDAIDEPNEGVTNGRQPITGDEGSFIPDWQQAYYELPPHEHQRLEEEETGFAAVQSALKPGCRVAVAFGSADAGGVSWYGGQMFEYRPAKDEYVIGFDDGDMRYITTASMEFFWEQNCFRLLDADAGGMIGNATGAPKVACAVYTKEGRAQAPSIVGFLVGETRDTVGGDTIYQAFYCHCEAKVEGVAEHNTRGGGGDNEAKEIARGMHSFKRGNIVEHNSHVIALDGTDPEESCKAHVFGVTFREKGFGVPGAKYLVLQEPESSVFFLGMWTQWSRTHEGARESWEAEDETTARMMTDEDIEKMVRQFQESNKLEHLSSRSKVQHHARHIAQNGPPHYEQQQKAIAQQQKQDSKRAAQEAAKVAKAAAKAAAMADAKAAAKAAARADAIKARAEKFRAKKQGGGRGGHNRPAVPKVTIRPLGPRPDHSSKSESGLGDDDTLSEHALADLWGDLARKPSGADAADEEKPPSPPLQPPSKKARHSPRLPPRLPEGWKEAKDGEGVQYYYNKALNISQFHYPGTATPPSSVSSSPALPPPQPKARRPSPVSSHPERACTAASVQSKPSSTNGYFARQRRAQIARLRAMLEATTADSMSSDRVLKMHGDLAALEMHAMEAGDPLS